MNNNSNNKNGNTNNDLTKTSTFYLDDPNLGLDVITNASSSKSAIIRTKQVPNSNSATDVPIKEADASPNLALASPHSLNTVYDSTMQDFLEQARNGNVTRLIELIESNKNLNASQSSNKNQFDINYKGKPKRFYGWTALHISCYFNHIEIVKLLLQHPDCDVNACNYENDTPLHKACLTSRYEIVELLLTHNAEINIKNNEGFKPKDLVTDPAIKKLIQAAENTETHNLQKQFFEAVTNNDIETINKLIRNKNFDLNCTDTFGNTALHLVSNRNSCEWAVLLIQKGINTLIKNQNQLTALDLAKSKEMKEILGYIPFNWRKYEGVLLKKRKFLGYKEYYVVLNKGSIIYYSNRKDANQDSNRKGTYFLNNAFIKEYPSNGSHDFPAYTWTINYTNGRKHTLCSAIPMKKRSEIVNETSAVSKITGSSNSKKTQLSQSERKRKWIQAINEHIRFSDSNLQQNDGQHMLPMESLQQNLNSLKLNEDKLNFLLIQIEQQFSTVSVADLSQIPSQSSLHQFLSNYKTNFDNLKAQIRTVIADVNKCLNLHEQRDSLLKSQLIEAKHKSELLEQSLRVIAQENHDLESKKLHEKSIGGKNGFKTSRNVSPSPAKISTEDELPNETASDDELEEFFDIADDPLTDEELDIDNKSVDNTIETTSLALRSCYGSIDDLNEGLKQNLADANSRPKSSSASETEHNKEARLSLIDVDMHGWRTRLPAKMFDRSQISIWSILKQFIGKELSKIAMPASLCEPLSFLQRITENVYYSDLLNKAADPNISASPCKRMEYVAAFAVTNISSNIDRLSKPFNPLLGETYELTREDLGFRILCEQVSHHPPVSAFHSESTNPNSNWKFYGSVNPKLKFWGKSIEVTPKGTLTLELNRFNETYTWQAVTCCVHNIIVGKLWFEYYGTMEITCHQTGYKAIINFKPYSWSNKELHKLDGYIYDNKKNKLKALYGYWTHCVYSCDPNEFDNYIKGNKPLPITQVDDLFNELPSTLSSSRQHAHSDSNFTNHNLSDKSNGNLNGESNAEQKLVDETQSKLSLINSSSSASISAQAGSSKLDVKEIWRAVPRPPYGSEYYMFNYFTITLNEMKEEFEKIIAPTDSRFRTDVRRLELGDLEGASQEKTRLEEKQRESRNKNGKYEYRGKWFQVNKHPVCNEEAWLFNNKYWLRNYSDCLNLY